MADTNFNKLMWIIIFVLSVCVILYFIYKQVYTRENFDGFFLYNTPVLFGFPLNRYPFGMYRETTGYGYRRPLYYGWSQLYTTPEEQNTLNLCY